MSDSTSTRPRVVLLMALAAALGGCGVSKEIVAEKDALLGDYESKLALCEEQKAALQRSHDATNVTLATRERELEACRQETLVGAEESEDLLEREAELRARLASELADKNVEIERLKDSLSVRVLDEILFASGSAKIRSTGQDVLAKVAAAIRDTEENLRVEGHTDDVPIGPELQAKYPSNWELSGARAASVVRYFETTQAIDPLRMEAVGHSQYRPVAENDSEENRQRNRRVELVLTRAEPNP